MDELWEFKRIAFFFLEDSDVSSNFLSALVILVTSFVEILNIRSDTLDRYIGVTLLGQCRFFEEKNLDDPWLCIFRNNLGGHFFRLNGNHRYSS